MSILTSRLVDRVDEISTAPNRETIVLVGHGSGNDKVNDRWLELLASLARDIGERWDGFRAIRYHTWRERLAR